MPRHTALFALALILACSSPRMGTTGNGVAAMPDAGCSASSPCELACLACDGVGATDPACTPLDEVPPFCAGHAGVCVRYERTTPPGQIADCFPVADEVPLAPGVCRSGVCVDH